MGIRYWFCLGFTISCIITRINASEGDSNPLYKACLEECENTGCVNDICFPHCKISSSDGISAKELFYLQWKQWNCKSDCRYHCMLNAEKQRQSLGTNPVKYHGKWPFKRVFGIQEPASVALSALNLAVQFYGWITFIILVYYKLPLHPQTRKPYYAYTGLLHVYGLLAMNSWLWSAVFHTRDVELTEKLDYSSVVALLGYSLILALLRIFNVKNEATRVMFAAPFIAFITTHILYLNFYKLDYGWNMTVCVIMGIAQLLLWAGWAGMTQHPSKWKIWAVVLGTSLGLLLEIYDFPPYWDYVDAHALWHATTVPLTYLWWSFVKDDADTMTSDFLKKAK